MPKEMSAKPSREVRWGMADSREGDVRCLTRNRLRCHFVNGIVVGRIFQERFPSTAAVRSLFRSCARLSRENFPESQQALAAEASLEISGTLDSRLRT